MSEIELTGSKGNINFLKDKFLKSSASGEKILAAHYEMEFVGYPDATIRVDATQIPAIQREMVEGRTAMGNMDYQQGNLINAGEITVTVYETLKGDMLKMVRDMVFNKKHVDIIIRITPESLGGESAVAVKLSRCFIGSDLIDLGNENVTEYVKVPLLVRYNWIEPVDE